MRTRKKQKRFPAKSVEIRFIKREKAGDWNTIKGGTFYYFEAWYKGKEIGDMSCYRIGKKMFVNTVYVKPTFRMCGVGRKLYEHILLTYGNICTYYHQASEDAQRVWRYLAKNYIFEVEFFKDIIIIYKDPRQGLTT